MSYKQRQGVSFTKPRDPAFLQRLRTQLGYQEPATIEDKRVVLETDHDDESDLHSVKVENRPQVVVVDPFKDLNQEQVDKELQEKQHLDDLKKIEEGRISFNKPQKRQKDPETSENRKKLRSDSLTAKKEERLLSFVDLDAENDDDYDR